MNTLYYGDNLEILRKLSRLGQAKRGPTIS